MKEKMERIGISQWIGSVLRVCSEEMRRVCKDEGALMFFILVPLLYPLLYAWIYNNEVVREVPVAVVDCSHSHESRLFLRMFDASPDTRVAYYCNNLEEARDLVARQVVKGVLYFPTDYSLQLRRGEQATVGVYCDMSLMLTYKAIFQTAQTVALRHNGEIQVALSGAMTERDEELTVHPIQIEEVPIYNATGGYGNAILPAVLVLVLQQTLLLGIGLLAGSERERLRSGKGFATVGFGDGMVSLIVGRALCYFLLYVVMAAYVTLCVPRFFHFTVLSTAMPLLALLIPYLLACVFLGMAVAHFVRYRENVILLVVFTSVPLLFLSGVSWPKSNFPACWHYVSMLFPSTFGIRGFLKVNSMGAPLADIRMECVALWAHAVVYFFLAYASFRRLKKQESQLPE